MTTAYLASSAVMGVLVVAVVLYMVRVRGWYRYSPPVSTTGWSPGVDRRSRLSGIADQTAVWVLGFAFLVVGGLLGVLAYVAGPVESQPMVGLVVGGAGSLLLVGYLLYGVYISAKRRGHPSSLAAAESATLAAMLFMVAATVQLVM